MPKPYFLFWAMLGIFGLGGLSALHGAQSPWKLLEMPQAQFSEKQVGVHSVVLDGVASQLAIFVYREYAEKIWQKDALALQIGRGYLILAHHMSPQNTAVRKINEWLATETRLKQPPDVEQPAVFAETMLQAVNLLRAQKSQPSERLADWLSLVAADIYPLHEAHILAAEKFRTSLGGAPGLVKAWAELMRPDASTQPQQP